MNSPYIPRTPYNPNEAPPTIPVGASRHIGNIDLYAPILTQTELPSKEIAWAPSTVEIRHITILHDEAPIRRVPNRAVTDGTPYARVYIQLKLDGIKIINIPTPLPTVKTPRCTT